VQDCAVRDGYRLEDRVLFNTPYNAGNTWLGETSEEHRLAARHSLLYVKGTGSLLPVSWTVNQQGLSKIWHLRTRGKCRKHEPQASVFYISRVYTQMSGVFYRGVIHGLDFFICFMI